jgi:hypothetical protein
MYVDTSIVLAHLLAEDRQPPAEIWRESLVSSRLMIYEAWNRIQREHLASSHGPALGELLERFAWLDLRDEVLARAKDSFPVAVRTLDALHLASLWFLAQHHISAPLASFDDRLLGAARALDLPIASL